MPDHIQSLNFTDLDFEQLEQRVELGVVLPTLPNPTGCTCFGQYSPPCRDNTCGANQ